MVQTSRGAFIGLAAAQLLAVWALEAVQSEPVRAPSLSVRELRAASGACRDVHHLRAEPVPAGQAGLVVHLYGSGGSHKEYNVGRAPYDDFRRLLAARGYWLVVPELGPRHWMSDAACGQVDAVIAAMVQTERVDPARASARHEHGGREQPDLRHASSGEGRLRGGGLSDDRLRPVVAGEARISAAGRKGTRHHAGTSERGVGKISPVCHPEAFRKTPVFLLHGDRDAVVPPHHSRDLAAALKAGGCTVVYREVPGAVHNDSIALSCQRELADFLAPQRR